MTVVLVHSHYHLSEEEEREAIVLAYNYVREGKEPDFEEAHHRAIEDVMIQVYHRIGADVILAEEL